MKHFKLTLTHLFLAVLRTLCFISDWIELRSTSGHVSLKPGMSKEGGRIKMPKKGENLGNVMGDISANIFFFEWSIPDFASLPAEMGEPFVSPPFEACGGRWLLWIYPNGLFEGCMTLALNRRDAGPSVTVTAKLGIRGSEGIENKKQIGQEFSEEDRYCYCLTFCRRLKLEQNESRWMPGKRLNITCELTLDAPRVLRDASTQTVGEFSVSEVLNKDGKPTEKKGELPAEVLVLYPFKELETATQNFAGGCIIGEGAFGTVYRAVVKGNVVAVKKLKDPMDKQFIAELRTLTNYKHENLLPLLGCSLGTTCCLLYEYMTNGSLQDRLYEDSEPLTCPTRLSIAYGSALGINHLHTFGEKPMVHRDIKSANILLDRNFAPKVGDFGLVRTGSSGGSSVYAVTERFCGTRVYMPREAFMGDVSVKWDTFSFGMVLLELLTGLPPYRKRKNRDLISHMENCEDILPRLDPRGDWNQEAATDLYGIARRCIAESKRSRPYISEILEDLKKLSLLREKRSSF